MGTYYKFTEQGRAIAEQIVQEIRSMGGEAVIRDTWLDRGAEMMWETIITKAMHGVIKGMEFQLLNPVEFDRMNDGTITRAEIEDILDVLRKRG